MKQIILFLISLYQQIFPVRGHCRFYPTCSMYTREVIATHGLSTGLLMGIKRISKCHPFATSGIDFLEKGVR